MKYHEMAALAAGSKVAWHDALAARERECEVVRNRSGTLLLQYADEFGNCQDVTPRPCGLRLLGAVAPVPAAEEPHEVPVEAAPAAAFLLEAGDDKLPFDHFRAAFAAYRAARKAGKAARICTVAGGRVLPCYPES